MDFSTDFIGLNHLFATAGWNIFDLGLVLVSFVDVASVFFTRDPTVDVLQAVKILKMLSRLARHGRKLDFLWNLKGSYGKFSKMFKEFSNLCFFLLFIIPSGKFPLQDHDPRAWES